MNFAAALPEVEVEGRSPRIICPEWVKNMIDQYAAPATYR